MSTTSLNPIQRAGIGLALASLVAGGTVMVSPRNQHQPHQDYLRPHVKTHPSCPATSTMEQKRQAREAQESKSATPTLSKPTKSVQGNS